MKERLTKTGLSYVSTDKLISEIRHRSDVHCIGNQDKALEEIENILESEEIDYIVLKG